VAAGMVAVGQMWWDSRGAGFAEVRSVRGTPESGVRAVVSGPTEFWNDARSTRVARSVSAARMLDGDGWEGPFAEPAACPRAVFYPQYFCWGKPGLMP